MQTLDLPMEELEKFASDVLERFDNPYVDHQVTSIMLNSFPKFCARDLPGVKTYLERKGELPKGLVFGLAAIITYYKGGKREDGVEIVQCNQLLRRPIRKVALCGGSGSFLLEEAIQAGASALSRRVALTCESLNKKSKGTCHKES